MAGISAITRFAAIFISSVAIFATQVATQFFTGIWVALADITTHFVLHVSMITINHALLLGAGRTFTDLAAILIFLEAILTEHPAPVFGAFSWRACAHIAVVIILLVAMWTFKIAVQSWASLTSAFAEVAPVAVFGKAVFAKHPAVPPGAFCDQTIASIAAAFVFLVARQAFIFAGISRARRSWQGYSNALDINTDPIDAIIP
jgi:hypothetical protein